MTKLKSAYAVIGISLLSITTAVLLVLPCLVSRGNAQAPKPNPKPDEPFCSRESYTDCNELTAKWPPLCDTGKAQSPIDLKSATAKKVSDSILSFNRQYQQDIFRFGVANYGYRVAGFFNQNTSSNALVGVVDTETVYTFSVFQLYWGENSSRGSEHLVDGKRFAAELQLLHYRSDYTSLDHALSQNVENPVLTISILYNQGPQDNLNLKTMVDLLSNDLKDGATGAKYADKTINLFKLIPKKGLFYRYKGSLTTPQCHEKVLWIVYKEPQEIGAAQLSQLRTLVSTYMPVMNDRFNLSDNYRSEKALNGRTVELITDQVVGTKQMLVSWGLILLSLLCQHVHSNFT